MMDLVSLPAPVPRQPAHSGDEALLSSVHLSGLISNMKTGAKENMNRSWGSWVVMKSVHRFRCVQVENFRMWLWFPYWQKINTDTCVFLSQKLRSLYGMILFCWYFASDLLSNGHRHWVSFPTRCMVLRVAVTRFSVNMRMVTFPSP